MQETLHEGLDDHSASHNSDNDEHGEESNRQDKGDYQRLESELKYFIDADDDEIEDDYQGSDSAEGNDKNREAQGKLQVEKKLDYLFNKEVDINKVYYDSGEQVVQQIPNTKPVSTEPQGIGSFFSHDTGKRTINKN